MNKYKIDQVLQETMCFSFSEGDFLHRCLPKTYEYYGNMHLYKNHLGKAKDDFDDFIISEIPLFEFLCERYYLENKKAKLSLSQISDEKQLFHFDEMIVSYLKTKNQETYQHIAKLYIYMLEMKLVKLLNEKLV